LSKTYILFNLVSGRVQMLFKANINKPTSKKLYDYSS
jgi:hypothetical protein